MNLTDIDPDTIKKVPHLGETIDCKVIDIYDGDTVTVIFMHGDQVPFKIKIRVNGVDTPEIRSAKSELEKVKALFIRDQLRDLLLNHIVKLTIVKWDKYGGRIVGDVYLPDNTLVSDYLLKHSYAKPYDGKTKKEGWTIEQLNKIE